MASTIGIIDLSRQRLRLLLAERGKDPAPLIREEVPLPEGLAGLDQALQTLQDAELLIADRWMIALSSDLFSLHHMSLPLSDLRKAKLALEFELEAELPFKREDVVVSTRLRKDGDKTAVLALVSPRAELSGIVAALQAHGVEPTTIVPSCTGLARPELLRGPTIVVDIGATCTELVAVREQELVALVSIDEGGETVNRALARSHYLDPAEAERVKLNEGQTAEGQEALGPATRALAGHLSRGMRSIQRQLGWRECTVVLGGGGACMPRLAELLSTEMGQPVDLAIETDSLVSDEATSLAWAPELGLLRDLRAGRSWVPMNLRTDSLAYQGDFLKALKAVSGLGTWAAIILLLLSGQVFADIHVRYNQAERFDLARQQACSQITGLPSSTAFQCLANMEEAVGGTGKGDIPRYDALDVYAGISASVPAALDVKIDVTRIDAKTLRLEGSTTGFHQASQLNEALSKAPCVTELRSDKTVKQGDKVRFTFSGKVDCSKRPPADQLLSKAPKKNLRRPSRSKSPQKAYKSQKSRESSTAPSPFNPPRKKALPPGLSAPGGSQPSIHSKSMGGDGSGASGDDDDGDEDGSGFKPPPKIHLDLPSTSPMKLHMPELKKGVSATYGGKVPPDDSDDDDSDGVEETE